MSRLLDQLNKDLAEAEGQERYTDLSIVVRRLTLRYVGTRPAPGPCRSSDGTEWNIPSRSSDHLIPVSSSVVRASSSYHDGIELYRDNQLIGTLGVEVIAAAGGVWDALYNTWALDERGHRRRSERPIVFDARESQVQFMRNFAAWLRSFRDRKDIQQDGAILYGGRRSGKTVIGNLGVILAAVDLGRIDNTPLVAWLVSTNHPARVELDKELRSLLPASWYIYREMPSVVSPAHTYSLLNGAEITHRTADDPEELRVGRCDIALMNEAGKMAKLAFQNTLNAIADKGGFVLLTSNRPRRTKANWIALLAKEQKKLGPKATFPFFELDPALNDAIRQDTRQRVLALLQQLDPDEADEGELLEVGSYVYTPPFDDLVHVQAMPDVGLPDLTREVSRKIGGVERDFLVGADFQGRPAMVASCWKVVGRLPDQWHLWCVQSFFVEDSDEDGLIDELLAEEYTPENSLIIGDASGQWQKGDHQSGPTSFRFFRSRRYVITGAQKKIGQSGQYSCNPRPKEAAVGRVNNLLRLERANTHRGLMVSAAEHASTMAISLRKCRAGRGRFGVVPKGDHSHLTDTATYVTWAVLSVLHHAEARAKAGGMRRKTLAEMRAEVGLR